MSSQSRTEKSTGENHPVFCSLRNTKVSVYMLNNSHSKKQICPKLSVPKMSGAFCHLIVCVFLANHLYCCNVPPIFMGVYTTTDMKRRKLGKIKICYKISTVNNAHAFAMWVHSFIQYDIGLKYPVPLSPSIKLYSILVTLHNISFHTKNFSFNNHCIVFDQNNCGFLEEQELRIDENAQVHYCTGTIPYMGVN